MSKNSVSFVSGVCLFVIGILMLGIHGRMTTTSDDFGTGVIVGLTLGVGAAILIMRVLDTRDEEQL